MTFVRIAAAAAALAVAVPAFAQETRPQLGLGVGITPNERFDGFPTTQIYVPFRIAPNFRIEPSLGIFTTDTDAEETSNFTLGVGAFFVQRMAGNADLYAGGRLALNFASVDTGVADDSDTDLFISGAVGGEYFLAPKFSIGLEGQLGLYQTGDVNGDASGFFTNGLGFLRIYL